MTGGLSIATWNILADAYIRPQYYPHTPAEWLRPEKRRPALLAGLRALDADILCLQEVEEDFFREIASTLDDYQCRYLKKAGGKPDGCATCFRGLTLKECNEIRYSDDSGHVALVLALDGATIANTHLKWSPPEKRVGYGQMRELLERLPQGTVVCGDLNVTPDSEVILLAAKRGLRPAHPAGAVTCNANRAAKKIDYLLHDASLPARPDPVPPIDNDTPLPSEMHPSDHLPLRVVFG